MSDMHQQRQSDGKRTARKLLGGVFATSAVLLGAAAPAFAGVAISATVDPPSSVVVGQTGVPASVTVRNISTGSAAANGLTLEQVTLVPSCGTQAILGVDCPLAAVELGVLGLTTTGVGEVGTGCAGVTFNAGLIDLIQGKLQLTSQAPVVLGPVGSLTSICVVDFTLDVLGVPLLDANPHAAGLQIDLVAAARAVDANGNRTGSYGSNEITVNPGSLKLTTPPAVAAALTQPAATPATATPPAAVVLPVATAAASTVAKSKPAAKKHAAKKAAAVRKRHARHHAKHHVRAAAHHAKQAHSHSRKA